MTTRRTAPTRREVLAGGVAVAAAACVPPTSGPPTIDAQAFDQASRVAFSPAAIAWSEALFPQTVSSGAMKADSVLLWTRATAPTVTLRVWRDVGSQAEVALVTERVLSVPAEHGNVKATIDGLAPATWYTYAFFSSDLSARSPIGRVRTAFPADWREPLTVGATSCASYRYRPFTPLEALARQPMDLWLHLGDVAYTDGADSLASYREKWREQLKDPGYRALFPTAGAYLVWDDHEFLNNVDPEAMGVDSGLITSAVTTFRETLPVEEDRAWRSYRWGLTAEFFLLDLRLERKPSTREGPDAQFISPAQLAWLQEGLAASPCHFKVVLTSVPITNFPLASWPGRADRWQGYAAQREKVLSFLETQAVKNVWFVSGDIHLGTIMRVDASGPRRKYFEVCVGPAGNVNPLSVVIESGVPRDLADFFPPEQFLYQSGAFQATTLTFDPKTDTVRVRFFDPKQGDAVTCDQALRFGQGA
jgi:alkaline phosphatase D